MLLRAFPAILLVLCLFLPQVAFASGEKKQGGALICSFPGEAGSLDPADASDPASVNMESAIFEGLVALSDDGSRIMPSLAKRWYTKDFKVWTFELKKNVKFHDGTDLTSSAVKFSIERLLHASDSASGHEAAEYFREIAAGKGSRIARIETPEINKVRISLSEPDIGFLRKLAVPAASIVSPYSAKKLGAGFGLSPAGTGPYRFSDMRRQGRIVLARNIAYEGFVASDSLIFEGSSDFHSSVRHMVRGNTDVILGVSQDDMGRLDKDSRLEHRHSGENLFYSLLLNPTRREFSSSSRRRAVSSLINRKDLAVSYGMKEAYSFLLPCHNEFVKKDFSFDMADIAELSANIPKNRIFDLIYDAGDGALAGINENIACSVQNYMRAGGIKVSVRGLDSGEYRAALASRNYDMAVRGKCDYALCADAHLLSLRSLASFRKSCYVGSPWIDDFYAVLRDARKSSSQKERRKLYGKADGILLRHMPEIPLCSGRQHFIVSPNVFGNGCSSAGIFRFDSMSVAR